MAGLESASWTLFDISRLACIFLLEMGLLIFVLRISKYGAIRIAAIGISLLGFFLLFIGILWSMQLSCPPYIHPLHVQLAAIGLAGILAAVACSDGGVRRDLFILHGLIIGFVLLHCVILYCIMLVANEEMNSRTLMVP